MSDLNNNRIKLQVSKNVVAEHKNRNHLFKGELQLSLFMSLSKFSAQPNIGILQQSLKNTKFKLQMH